MFYCLYDQKYYKILLPVFWISGSTLTIEGETYGLKQFHFHTPSENNINGTSYPLETHFVHATKDGKLAVHSVSIL
jgi:carbonic anhydrase